MTHKKRVGLTISYIVLILISIIWLFPFFCLVLQSFRSYQSEFGGMVNYLVPKHFSLDSYKFLFSEGCQFTRWYGNTFIIACFVSVLQTLVIIFVSYALPAQAAGPDPGRSGPRIDPDLCGFLRYGILCLQGLL